MAKSHFIVELQTSIQENTNGVLREDHELRQDYWLTWDYWDYLTDQCVADGIIVCLNEE